MDALQLADAAIGCRLVAIFESGYGLDEGYFHNDISTMILTPNQQQYKLGRCFVVIKYKKGHSMANIDSLVQDFLAQKKIAVVGVSDKRDTGCNLAYRKFKSAGYSVTAVNPRIGTFEGDPCYPDLKSIPEKPDGVFILTNPKITKQVVQQCVELGIQRVWMHCLMGTKPGLAASMTSVSPEAVRMCRENGITVIPGACPNQYLKPDFGHSLMRVMFRTIGFHSIKEG